MSGYEGNGTAMMNFATHFLRGASEGRLRQFQQSEQTKKEHENSYDALIQHVQDSDAFPKAFKNQVWEDAALRKASAGKAALGGKPGKNDHPLVGLAHNLFDHVIGPSENKKHVDIGPQDIADLVQKMRDPANRLNMGDVSQTAGSNVGQIIDEMQATAKEHNVPLYQEDVPNHPKFGAAVRGLTNEGLNPLTNEGVSSRINTLPHRPTAAEQSKQDIPWVYSDANGAVNKTTVRRGLDGIYRDVGGTPIPLDDPRLTHGGAAGPYDVATARAAGQKDVQGLKNTGAANVANIRNQREVFQTHINNAGDLVRTQIAGFPKLVPDIGAPTPAPPGATAAPAAPDAGTPQPDGTPAPPVAAPATDQAQPSLPANIIDMATKAATANGLPPAVYLSLIHAESSGNPNAIGPETTSGEHALGLAQLMPGTAKELGVTNPMDPQQSVEAGAKYLKKLLDQNGGDMNKALAAYNAGPGRAANGKALPEETTNYVAKVTKNAEAFANPKAGGQNAAPATATGATQRLGPHEGVVGAGFPVKTNANAPVTWTAEQNTLAQAPVGPTGRRDEFLATWPLQDQINMKLIANYQYKLPGGTKGAITSPLVRSYMASVKAYNPSFDASKYDNRVALRKDFDFGGKDFQNIQSLNTALVHLGGLDEATAKLDNATFKPYNTFANWLVKNAGSDQVKPFETYRTAFNSEMARALKGGVADKSEIDDWKHNIDTSDSPKAAQAAFKSVANIIAGRIGEQAANYERGMGEPPESPLISPKANAVLMRLGGANARPTPTAPAPNPNPNGYEKGHYYGKAHMQYLGVDPANPNNPANWKR